VPRDSTRLPSSVVLSPGFQPGLLAKPGQQSIGVEAEEILSRNVLSVLEFSAQQPHLVEVECPGNWCRRRLDTQFRFAIPDGFGGGVGNSKNGQYGGKDGFHGFVQVKVSYGTGSFSHQSFLDLHPDHRQ